MTNKLIIQEIEKARIEGMKAILNTMRNTTKEIPTITISELLTIAENFIIGVSYDK